MQRHFQRGLCNLRVPVDGLCLPLLNHFRFILIEVFNVFRRFCPGEKLDFFQGAQKHMDNCIPT